MYPDPNNEVRSVRTIAEANLDADVPADQVDTLGRFQITSTLHAQLDDAMTRVVDRRWTTDVLLTLADWEGTAVHVAVEAEGLRRLIGVAQAALAHLEANAPAAELEGNGN